MSIGIISKFNRATREGFLVAPSGEQQEIAFESSQLHESYENPEEGDWCRYRIQRSTLYDIALLQNDAEAISLVFREYSVLQDERPPLNDIVLHVCTGCLSQPAGAQLIATGLWEVLQERGTEITASIRRLVLDKELYPLLSEVFFKELGDTQNLLSTQLIQEELLSIELLQKEIDWKLFIKAFKDGLSFSTFRSLLIQRIHELNNKKGIFSFLDSLSLSTCLALYEAEEEDAFPPMPPSLGAFLYKKTKGDFPTLFSPQQTLSDEILFLCALAKQDASLFNYINQLDRVIEWIRYQDAYLVGQTLKLVSALEPSLKTRLEELDAPRLFTAISCENSIEEQTRILLSLSDIVSLAIIAQAKENPELQEMYGKRLLVKWEQSLLYATALDLEVDKKGKLKEFALRKGAATILGPGDEQANQKIATALATSQIVIGHNIRRWDLPYLKTTRKIELPSCFVWDTLEFECLLTPVRYSFALRVTHRALEDTELALRLFWNQIYRLSKDKDLLEELRELLPSSITQVLQLLQYEPAQDFFAQHLGDDSQFFYQLRALSPSVKEKFASLPKDEKILLIADKSLWATCARELTLAFPTNENDKYIHLSLNRVEAKPLDNPLTQLIVKRFCKQAKTPAPFMLSRYLCLPDNDSHTYKSPTPSLIEYFSSNNLCTKTALIPKVLSRYLGKADSNIHCVDYSGFDKPHIRNYQYDSILILESDIHDRMNTCEFKNTWQMDSLLKSNFFLPLFMHNRKYIPLSQEDSQKLNLPPQNLASNRWLTKNKDSSFTIYETYACNAHKNLRAIYPNARIESIRYRLDGQAENTEPPRIVYSQPHSENSFAYEDQRFDSDTMRRASYWTYQCAMVSELHKKHPQLPIVYIIHTKDEIEPLSNLLQLFGFSIPKEGSLLKKLEDLTSPSKSNLLVVSEEDFFEQILNYEIDTTAVFVWDSLNLQLYQIIWRGLPIDGTDNELNFINVFDEDDDENTISFYDETQKLSGKQCLEILWPLVLEKNAIIQTNSPDSILYLIDPVFESYVELPSKLQTKAYPLRLPWKTKADYYQDYQKSDYYFKTSPSQEQLNTEIALKAISSILIAGKRLKDAQIPIMEHMLKKDGDCLVRLPTGMGKSILFQGPALIRGASTGKLTIVISPLRTLLHDQVYPLNKKGFVGMVEYLCSDFVIAKEEQIYRAIKSGAVILLFITPEQMRKRRFLNVLTDRMEMDNGLEYVVFDEAHCIEQWGTEFRPDYLRVLKQFKKIRDKKGTGYFMFALFSATVTRQMESELTKVLPLICLGELNANPVRDHIKMEFHQVEPDFNSRIFPAIRFYNAQKLDIEKSKTMFFSATRKETEVAAESLEIATMSEEFSTTPFGATRNHISHFHAGLDSYTRQDIYQRFRSSDPQEQFCLLVATKAFGMGMDIPNIHFILHLKPPRSLEDLFQEVGRAGRDEQLFYECRPDFPYIQAICFFSPEDFKNFKKLLIDTGVSWENLSSAKQAVIDFCLCYRHPEELLWREDKDGNPLPSCHPVIVPSNVWLKNPQKFNQITPTEIALYKLEDMGIFHFGFTGVSCLNITLNISAICSIFPKRPRLLKTLFSFQNSNKKGDSFLVPLSDLRKKMRVDISKIIDSLLYYMEKKCISINNTMYCTLLDARFAEVKYMVQQDKNIFTLHIIINIIRSILEICPEGEWRGIKQGEQNKLCERAFKELEEQFISEERKKDNDYCMPWYEPNTITRSLFKWSSFQSHIRRVTDKVFDIISFLPGLSYIRDFKDEKGVVHRLRVKSQASWQLALDDYESYGFAMLKYLLAQQNQSYRWSSVISELKIREKGFTFFENLLTFLKILGYIVHSPLIPAGVEVYFTEQTFDEIPSQWNMTSRYANDYKSFEEADKFRKIRLACVQALSLLPARNHGNFVKAYNNCLVYDDYILLLEGYFDKKSPLLSEVREDALKNEENRIMDNQEQYDIYCMPTSTNINVVAGPGSGKTHILTLRCAKLLYKDYIPPSQILILAYTAAVVNEIRSRTIDLFSRLGVSKIGESLHIHTFHSLVKMVMPDVLENIEMENWEETLLTSLQNEPQRFKEKFPLLSHILVDEAQDMTTVRANCLSGIASLYPENQVRFFIIGDPDQSIYGFDRVRGKVSNLEYADMLKPQVHYEKFERQHRMVKMSMHTNYRSFPQIPRFAEKLLDKKVAMTHAPDYLVQNEPDTPYVFVIDNTQHGSPVWYNDLNGRILEHIKQENKTGIPYRQIHTVGILCRTNEEVFRAFSRLSKMPELKDYNICIQGTSICEAWRMREIYYMISILQKTPEKPFSQQSLDFLKGKIVEKITHQKNWDAYHLDVAYSLLLQFSKTSQFQESKPTYQDVIFFIKDIAGNDDGGQIYKIYNLHEKNHILKRNSLTITLSTMHKVKGLSFDVVITIPSYIKSPLKSHYGLDKDKADEADFCEEKRLLYVACTRAKKALYMYRGQRESRILSNACFSGYKENQTGFMEKEQSLENYIISASASKYMKKNFSYIENSLTINTPATIKKVTTNIHEFYNIFCNEVCVGSLSPKSKIREAMQNKKINQLNNFIVSGIYVSTYEDALRYDKKKKEEIDTGKLKQTYRSIAQQWDDDAIIRGYTYVVTIAGFGIPQVASETTKKPE